MTGQADWDNIKCYLRSCDFFNLFDAKADYSAEFVFNTFYSYVYQCIDLFVPVKTVGPCNNNNSAARKYPANIRRLVNKKAKAWRTYHSSGSPASLSIYKQHAAHCHTAINTFVSSCEEKLVDSGNISAFYRYANRKLSSKSAIGPLLDTDGTTITDSQTKAEVLSNCFSSNFTRDNGIIPSIDRSINRSCLRSINFNPITVEYAIKKMKGKKTYGGPDGIPPIFIKTCINELKFPLAKLFQLSFNTGYLPDEWRRAYITPIFKKGSTTDPHNYRPIAQTSSLCKIMERVIKDQLLTFLTSNSHISPNQHAFIAHHSTATNLLECTNDWSIAINSSNSVDIIYIDFSKAFDSIVFDKLLYKLSLYGISGNLLNWIEHFLKGRSQCVAVDGCLPAVSEVLSGVPQGSVLGPVLFLIFINDIIDICSGEVTIKLFADDAKLYSVITSSNHLASLSLQRSLDNLITWSSIWQLYINIIKCNLLTIVDSNNHLLSHL